MYNNNNTNRKLSKKEKRNNQGTEQKRTGLKINYVDWLTENQRKVADSYYSGKNLFLHGSAGTGKSFLLMYLSIRDLIEETCDQHKLIIIRSAVASRKIGFLPGRLDEKIKVFEDPYYNICSELFSRGDAYQILKQRHLIEFTDTSFKRGMTFSDSIVFIDEIQNMMDTEIHTIVTRLGNNSKLLIAGDIRQNDLINTREQSGLQDFIKIAKEMKAFDFIEFQAEDIVRSSFVKDYIMTRNKLEDEGIVGSLLEPSW